MRRNVLLLQGPVGPFFRNFAHELEHNGFQVFKINFNGGDRLYFGGQRAFDYRAGPSQWEAYLEAFLSDRDVGRIYLFGDCRFYHKIACSVAQRHNVRVFVFEEGYIRPNYITLEESGVNGNSSLIGKPLDLNESSERDISGVKNPRRVFRNMAFCAMSYYLACAALSWRFTDYVHHRPLNPISEGGKWLLSVMRKVRFKVSQRKLPKLFEHDLINQYFLCPLQVHCDMQISAHSEFTSVEHFIGKVVSSFAQHAEQDHCLVFKHHPMDRGYTDYTTLINKLAFEHSVEDRVYYVHDLELPSLLKGARGTVLINSTVGMSSLLHKTPVKTLGQAVYDRAELTSQADLDAFWREPGEVDLSAYQAFRDYLVEKNQINGSFYKRLPDTETTTGLSWSREMLLEHSYTPDLIDSAKPPTLQLVAGRDLDQTVSEESTAYGKLASR